MYPGENWSTEERWLRMMVYVLGTLVVLATYILLICLLMWLNIDEHRAAGISGCIAWVVGIPLGRPLCSLFWPDRVRRAEENAGKRYGFL
jgi:hypothetical protein